MCRHTKYREVEIIIMLGNFKYIKPRKEQRGNHQGSGLKVRVGSRWRTGNSVWSWCPGKETKLTGLGRGVEGLLGAETMGAYYCLKGIWN